TACRARRPDGVSQRRLSAGSRTLSYRNVRGHRSAVDLGFAFVNPRTRGFRFRNAGVISSAARPAWQGLDLAHTAAGPFRSTGELSHGPVQAATRVPSCIVTAHEPDTDRERRGQDDG